MIGWALRSDKNCKLLVSCESVHGEKPREILAANKPSFKSYHLGRKKDWVGLFCILIFLAAEKQIKKSKKQHMVSYRIIENICK